jgi:chromosome partitioning protein
MLVGTIEASVIGINRQYICDKRVVMFWNESGGVGKTTLAVNTDTMLGCRDNDVLAVDRDPQSGSFTDHIGHEKYKANKRDYFGDVHIKFR